MVTNMREQIRQVLDDLKRESRKAFERQLSQLHSMDVAQLGSRGGAFRDNVSRDMKNGALRALDLSAYDIVSDAVLRVSPISRTPSAFAEIERATVSLFLDLSQVLEAWYQRKVALPSAKIVDTSRAEAMRRRLERQLDTYRSEFTNHSAVPTNPKSTAGRNPKYDWVAASNAVWGKLYRAELTPEKDAQAGIETALLEYFAKMDEEPGVSTVRPYARDIYKEATKKA
jgi:hypothetical protein